MTCFYGHDRVRGFDQVRDGVADVDQTRARQQSHVRVAPSSGKLRRVTRDKTDREANVKSKMLISVQK